MGFADFLRPKWRSSNPDARRAAVEQLSSQETLAHVAASDELAAIRQLAVQRLNEQHALFSAATTDSDPLVRRAAVERLTDQHALAVVLDRESDARVLAEAVARVKDQWLLLQVLRSAKTRFVWEAALAGITNESMLVIVVYEHPDANMRESAASRIVTEAEHIRFVQSHRDSRVRLIAARAIHDQPTLVRLAINDLDADVRAETVERIEDQDVLVYVVNHEADDWVRVRALRTLREPLRVLDLAKRHQPHILCEELLRAIPESVREQIVVEPQWDIHARVCALGMLSASRVRAMGVLPSTLTNAFLRSAFPWFSRDAFPLESQIRNIALLPVVTEVLTNSIDVVADHILDMLRYACESELSEKQELETVYDVRDCGGSGFLDFSHGRWVTRTFRAPLDELQEIASAELTRRHGLERS